jgi:hypothetical protein
MSKYEEDMRIANEIVAELADGASAVPIEKYLPMPAYPKKPTVRTQAQYFEEQNIVKKRRKRIREEVKGIMRHKYNRLIKNGSGTIMCIPTEHVNAHISRDARQHMSSAISILVSGADYEGFTLSNIAGAVIANLDKDIDLLNQGDE